jgi:hypothetical protein
MTGRAEAGSAIEPNGGKTMPFFWAQLAVRNGNCQKSSELMN